MAAWDDVASTTGTGLSQTATLPGGAPDADHYLVAVVGLSSSTVASNSWGATEQSVSGVNGSTRLALFVKQGDGVTASFTATALVAVAGNFTVVLLSIPATGPIAGSYGGNLTLTGTSDTYSTPASASADVVAIAAEMLSGTPAAMGASWGESGDWDAVPVSLAVQQRLAVAVRDVDAGATPTVSWSWGNSRIARRAILLLGRPAAPTRPDYVGAADLSIIFLAPDPESLYVGPAT